jgi:hypothetical protein
MSLKRPRRLGSIPASAVATSASLRAAFIEEAARDTIDGSPVKVSNHILRILARGELNDARALRVTLLVLEDYHLDGTDSV